MIKLKTYIKYTLLRKWRKEPHKIRMRIGEMEFNGVWGITSLFPSIGAPLRYIEVSYKNHSNEIFNSVITYHHWNEMKLSHYKIKRMLKYEI